MEEEEEKGINEVLDEVYALIDQGYYITPRLEKKANTLYLYNELGESKPIPLSRFSRKEQKEIHEKAKEYASKVREKLKRLEKQESVQEGGAEEKEEKRAPARTYPQAGTGRRLTLEALDRSHAKLVQNITERVSWFADVLNEIGFYATLIAMQHAKVPPDELYDRIVDFKSPQEFASFVKDHLVALLEAREQAQQIIEYRKKLDILDAKLAMLEEVIEQLKQQRDQAVIALYAAVSTMDEEQLRNFIMNLMVAQYGLSVKLPQTQIPYYNNMNTGTGGVEVGAGRTDGEGVSEEEGNT